MGAAKNDQIFSFDVVSCLIASPTESGVTVGARQYALIAKIHASKSASSYEHISGAVRARAKQINEPVSKGEGPRREYISPLMASPKPSTIQHERYCISLRRLATRPSTNSPRKMWRR